MADADVLVHSSAVYLYKYDAAAGQYAPQSEAVVGGALLAAAAGDAFKLLFYHSQTKQPLAATPVTSATRFTPQQNHYVNFYDAAQQNYSMRFKDAAATAAFLKAVALTKAQALALDQAAYRDTTRAHVAQYDDLDLGKESSSGGVAPGDVVGLAWTSWQGLLSTNAAFFSQNPLDIEKKTPNEVVQKDGELKRIILGDANADPLSRGIAEAVVGMHKHGRRVVTVVLPASQQWFIGEVELVKVKKGKGGSVSRQDTAAPVAQNAHVSQDDNATGSPSSHDDLIERMAALSRAGSQGTALMANLNARSSLASPEKQLRQSSSGGLVPAAEERRRSSHSVEDAILNPGMVPVPLPGIVSTPDSKYSGSRRPSQQPLPTLSEPQQQPPQQQRYESVTARVLSTATSDYQTQEPSSFTPTPSPLQSTTFASPEMDDLKKQQSELDDLRRKLEESKRRLEQQHSEPSATTSATSLPPSASASAAGSSSFSNALTLALPPFSTQQPSPLPSSTGSTNGFTPWQPSSATSAAPPPFAPSFSPSLPTPGIRLPDFGGLPSFNSSLVPAPTSPSVAPFGLKTSTNAVSSPELENNIMRLQRSSTSIESTLHDIQSKMDRLLNMQTSLKTTKYTPLSTPSTLYTSTVGGGATSSTSSSSSLLKNLEKALAQRDQLQDLNARLQDSKEQMESTIEELQNQHESLQLENRNLLEKLQNGNYMQQEKFRMELRNVQQQLSHTQEQMLAYQEENFRLRQELAAKDEQVAKEKAQVQEEARKQLEQLQRQLQVQVHQESKDTLDRLQADKLRLDKQLSELNSQKTQVEIERDSLSNQVRLLQSQQSQWADEKAQAQSQQDSRVKELHAQLQQAGADMSTLKQQLEKYRGENRQLIDLVESKEQQLAELQHAKTQQEYAALSELLKEFMNDIYFHFHDAFEEDAEYTGKEIVTAIRKILKQNTMEILSKLEEFWNQQHQ